MNISQWLKYAKIKLQNSNSASLDSLLLIQFVLKISKEHIFFLLKRKLTKIEFLILDFFLKRRINGEPMAYILKTKEFWSLKLNISSDVLIPRPETEILVEQVLKKISKKNTMNILDLGTGSGAIILALASERLNCLFFGVDNSISALSIAYKNSLFLNIKNVFFFYSNWFSHIKNRVFNIIVSNPPYLSYKVFYDSDISISFEPYNSLVSGKNGTECIYLIIKNAYKFLTHSGWLFIEHCDKQVYLVQNLFLKNYYCNIKSILDYSGKYRVTMGMINKK